MKRFVLCLTCLMLVLLSCSIKDSFSGTAESGNAKVFGLVVKKPGIPAEIVLVLFIPEKYNSLIHCALPDSLEDTTDSSEFYCIMVSHMGYYNVLAKHPALLTGFICVMRHKKPDQTFLS